MARFISILTAFTTLISHILFGVSSVPPVQRARNEEMLPNVYVGGLFNYGEQTPLWHSMPYPGIINNLQNLITAEGFEFYTASTGPFSSTWDRAANLFAELTGTRVDYGKAHSREHGHARFGRTHEQPLVPDWSPERPINLFGYSMGAQTIYLFAHLLAEGCPHERAVTPPEELSPLFAGGNEGLIHSITSLAGTLNGSTIEVAFLEDQSTLMHTMIFQPFLLFGRFGRLNAIYDLQLDHFGLSGVGGGIPFNPFRTSDVRDFFDSRDHTMFCLSPGGAAAINRVAATRPDIYYFSYALCITTYDETTGHWVVNREELLNMPLFYIFGNRMGRGEGRFYGRSYEYPGGRFTVDEGWWRNDGSTNVISAMYPFGAPNKEFDPNNIQRGTWQVMPIMHGYNHGFFGGFDFKHSIEDLRDFFLGHFEILEQTWPR